jgi:hypothetical protein
MTLINIPVKQILTLLPTWRTAVLSSSKNYSTLLQVVVNETDREPEHK